MALDILIVDDEQDIRDLVSGVLDDEGYGTRTAASADEALAALDERLPSLILLDVWLRGSSMDGIELLRAIKVRDPQIPVIVFRGTAISKPQLPPLAMVRRTSSKSHSKPASFCTWFRKRPRPNAFALKTRH